MKYLLTEFVDYAQYKKAEIIMRKCFANGKYSLGNKIRLKYKINSYPSDTEIAFSLLLKHVK